MNTADRWLRFLLLELLINPISTNIDTKENFCGTKLMRTLEQLCFMYNSPSTDHYRFRRQIVQECCRTPCSRRYLVRNYCYKPKSSILEELSKPIKEEFAAAHNRNVDIFDPTPMDIGSTTEKIQEQVIDTERMQKVLKSRRGKRNCKCKKRHRLRKNNVRNQGKSRRSPPPAAQLGHIEEYQTPFYVWKLF